MEYYQQKFCEFLLNSGALKIGTNPDREDGNFVLKSGRISPFFVNLGDLNNGQALSELGRAYAHTIHKYFKGKFDTVFGPAYKGIPIATAAALQYWDEYLVRIDYCSNRKEIKDHGDSGILLGHRPVDGERIVLVEDVTTSGKSIAETVPILQAQAKVEIIGLVVAFDRMEYGQDRTKTALQEVAEKYGIETHAILSMRDAVKHLHDTRQLTKTAWSSILDYYEQYSPTGTDGADICAWLDDEGHRAVVVS